MPGQIFPLLEEWVEARKELLEALARSEEWLKDAKRGGKEVVPNVLDKYWIRLSNAENALYKRIRENVGTN